MNRRGFFGLAGKLLAVGTAMGVSPGLLLPVKKKLEEWWTWEWVQVGGPDISLPQPAGTAFAFEIRMSGDGPEPEWVANLNQMIEFVETRVKKSTPT